MSIAVTSDDVPIWYDVAGAGPPLVLLPGRGDSSDLFPLLFTEIIVGAGYSVVRIDTRDSGLSGEGGDEYTMSTLADDVLVVLDHAGIDRAHMLGFSMGGIVLTDLASRRPDRVRSCVFVSAMSPDPDAGIGDQFFSSLDEHDAVAASLAAMGSPTEQDRVWIGTEVARSIERAPARPEAAARHQAAAFRLGWPEPDSLARIRAPVLAIHGTHDRSLPVAHAEAFEREVSNARAEYLDGMGHLPTRAEWQRIARLVSASLARAQG